MDFAFTNFDEEVRAEKRRRETGADRTFTLDEHNAAIEAAVAKAREAAFEDGYAKGEEAANNSILDACSKSLLEISPALQGFLDKSVEHHQQLELEVLNFAASVCQRTFPEFIEARGWERAKAEISGVLKRALGRPKIRLIVSQDVKERMADDLEELAALAGHASHVEIVSREEFKNGEASVEWDNGFMHYSFDEVCGTILKAVNEFSNNSADTVKE